METALCSLVFLLCLVGSFQETHGAVKSVEDAESSSWRREAQIAADMAAFRCCGEWIEVIMILWQGSANLSAFDGHSNWWQDAARTPAGFSFCQRSIGAAKGLLLKLLHMERAADQYCVRVWWLSNLYWSFSWGCAMWGKKWLKGLKRWLQVILLN